MVDIVQGVLYCLAVVVLIYGSLIMESIVPPRAVRFLSIGFALFALGALVGVVSG